MRIDDDAVVFGQHAWWQRPRRLGGRFWRLRCSESEKQARRESSEPMGAGREHDAPQLERCGVMGEGEKGEDVASHQRAGAHQKHVVYNPRKCMYLHASFCTLHDCTLGSAWPRASCVAQTCEIPAGGLTWVDGGRERCLVNAHKKRTRKKKKKQKKKQKKQIKKKIKNNKYCSFY